MNTTIMVRCTDQVLTFTNTPIIASGGIEEDYVRFEFCGMWDGYTKTAVFWKTEALPYHAVLDQENTCKIPQEVLSKEGVIYFGVFGVNTSGQQRTSEILTYNICKGVITEGTVPSEPTQDIYMQLLAKCAEIESMFLDKADTVNGATAGNFAGLDAAGNYTDSGIAKQSFLDMQDTVAAQGDAAERLSATVAAQGDAAERLSATVSAQGTEAEKLAATVASQGTMANKIAATVDAHGVTLSEIKDTGLLTGALTTALSAAETDQHGAPQLRNVVIIPDSISPAVNQVPQGGIILQYTLDDPEPSNNAYYDKYTVAEEGLLYYERGNYSYADYQSASSGSLSITGSETYVFNDSTGKYSVSDEKVSHALAYDAENATGYTLYDTKNSDMTLITYRLYNKDDQYAVIEIYEESSSPVYGGDICGTFLERITATYGTYPTNGISGDYWYKFVSLVDAGGDSSEIAKVTGIYVRTGG